MRKVILGLIALALWLAVMVSFAAQTSEWQVSLTRGSSNTLVQVYKGQTREAAEEACRTAVPTNNATAITYTCGAARRVFVVTPSCASAPAPRTQNCPSGTTGTWTQTATVGPAPTCAITWSPATPPAGVCVAVPSPTPGQITLRWTAPTHNERICERTPAGVEVNCVGGDPLTNLAGYRLNYGTSGGSRPATIQFPANITQHTMTLSEGDWFFSVKAFNTFGVESAPSNVVQVQID